MTKIPTVPVLLWLLAGASPALAGRQFRTAPIPWLYAVNISAAWGSGAGGYWDRIFKVVVANISSIPQHVQVTAILNDGSFTQNATIPLHNQIYFNSANALSVGTLGTQMTAGSLTVPASAPQSLGASGTATDRMTALFNVDYAGPVSGTSGFLWMQGSLVFVIGIADDRGAVTAAVELSGGCANNCLVLNDVNSIAASGGQIIQLNGGRPF